MARDIKDTDELVLRNLLDKLMFDEKTTDSIEPTDSPIDYLAGAAGAKLGKAMVRDAGSIIGNQIGSIGKNIKPLQGTQIDNELARKGLFGKRVEQAAEKSAGMQYLGEEGIARQDDLRRAVSAEGAARDALERQARSMAAMREAKLAALRKLSNR